MTTTQEQFWQSNFGDDYSQRNTLATANLDQLYRERFGLSRRELNREFLKDLTITSALEVGCNIGNQLLALAHDWPAWRFAGLEINEEAARQARERLPQADIRQGSAQALPFADGAFDLVFTAGVLIHVHPDHHRQVMGEIIRVSRQYIWGFEYYAPTLTPINYRGHDERLWKMDFAQRYQEFFPQLRLLKEVRYPYREDPSLVDSMFIFEKA